MDLSPFLRINPCGYAGLEMIQTCDLQGPSSVIETGKVLEKHLIKLLDASTVRYQTGLENTDDH